MPVCPPTPSNSPSLLSRHYALSVLHVPTKAHLKTGASHFLIVASLSSSVIMSALHCTSWPLPHRATFADFPHMQARTSTHTRKVSASFQHLRQIGFDSQRRITKGNPQRRGRGEMGNPRGHKSTGFRWISSEGQIFHSLSLTKTSSPGV